MCSSDLELLEFEVDLPLMEANSGTMSEDELTQQVLQWVEDGLPGEPLEAMAVHATDWLAQSGECVPPPPQTITPQRRWLGYGP